MTSAKRLICVAAGAALVTGCADETPSSIGTESQAVGLSGSGLERPRRMVDPGFLVADPAQGGCVDRRQIYAGSCSHFETKEKVYLAVGADLPDGEYFFAVMDPSAKPGAFLDGADGNLSDTTPSRGATTASGDLRAVRTFTLHRGAIKEFRSAHAVSSAEGRPIIQVAPFDDTSNPKRLYVAALCSVEAELLVDCKLDMFRVHSDTVVPAPVSGMVYYDANTNGRLDEGEAGLANITVLYGDGAEARVVTERTGRFAVQLLPDTYTFTQVLMPRPAWIQTGNVYEQWKADGRGRASLDWSKSYAVSVLDETPISGLNFGNVCVGAGGARSISFWLSRKGMELISTADVAKLSEMELKGPNGDFDPSSPGELAAWLRTAPEGNLSVALSAELAALKLSAMHGFVRDEALVRARGARRANVSEFAMVRDLFEEVNEVLGDVRPEIRVEERKEVLKRALADANGNRSFAQPDVKMCRPVTE